MKRREGYELNIDSKPTIVQFRFTSEGITTRTYSSQIYDRRGESKESN